MVSEETQNLLQQFQGYQQQLQSLILQKESLRLQQIEIENALEELGKVKGEGYKIVGSIMVKKPVNELKKELEEKRESVNLRLKTLEKNESRLSEKIRDLQTKLQDLLKTETR